MGSSSIQRKCIFQIPKFQRLQNLLVCVFSFHPALEICMGKPKVQNNTYFIEPSFLCLMLYICYLSHSIYCLVIPFLQ